MDIAIPMQKKTKGQRQKSVFRHNAADYLISCKIVYKGTSLEKGVELFNISDSKKCYLISWDDDIVKKL